MTIAGVITRGRRAAFVAECVLYPVSAAVFATMFTLLWAFDGGPPFLEPGGPVALVVVLLLVGAAATGALHRYRRPDRAVPIGLVVLAVQAVGLTAPLGPSPLSLLGWMLEMGPGPVLLGAVVRRARPVVGFLASAVAVAVAVALGSFVPQVDGDGGPVLRVWDLGPVVVIAVLPVLTGVVLRSLDTARRTADLARIRAEERLRVARELHDVIGNHVTGMTMYAQVAAADEAVPERARELLAAIEATGGDALAAMRRMVGALRSDDGVGDLDAMPPSATTLAGALEEAAASTRGAAVEVDPAVVDPPPDLVATVHRVAVEALTNVRRHAPGATTVRIAVDVPDPGRLAVEVVNDGHTGTRSGPPAPGSGYGLVGLRERLDAVGGTLEAGPVGGGRWRVRAELPHTPTAEHRRTAGLG
ncbi:sensor histidine kinase [Actinomycetospora termitidis]|uniref:histidine kinase n=1 Tax=Actinomycetospora termitidis TaxID=3053470 RepID=A0ABT7M3J6_9PSEU|nr:histidine kinase [Actinomycetospora sp. Odt1-22]MDL5155224.1 histidine kinase [Actinomycetospora sp. Odt1-22]